MFRAVQTAWCCFVLVVAMPGLLLGEFETDVREVAAPDGSLAPRRSIAGPVTIIFVDKDAAGANNGTSWANAYNDIYEGVQDPAVGGGAVQIWVAEGTYVVTGVASRGDPLVLVNNTEIYGGFAGTETMLSQRASNPLTVVTILTGDINGDDSPPFTTYFVNTSDNTYHVVDGSAVDSTARLDGLYLHGGRANGGGDNDNGAGIFINGGSPTLVDCAFQGNEADGFGGAVYVRAGGAPLLLSCIIDENIGGAGGGVYLNASSPTLTRLDVSNNVSIGGGGGMVCFNGSNPVLDRPSFFNNFANSNGGGLFITVGSAPVIRGSSFDVFPAFINSNSAAVGGGVYITGASLLLSHASVSGNSADSGAGIFLSSATVDVANTKFRLNTATGDGGAVYASASSPRIQNCLFSDNAAGGDGGALWADATAAPLMYNCTLFANVAGGQTGGVFKDAAGPVPVLRNSILWRNRDSGPTDFSAQIGGAGVSFGHSIVQGFTGAAGGNLGVDPLFVDPDGPNGVPGDGDDDFRLLFGSPAIDAGENDRIHPDFADLDGDMNTAEETPVDLDDTARRIDDPETLDTGSGSAPFVDIGAFEYFPDCNGNGIPDGQDLGPTVGGREIFWTDNQNDRVSRVALTGGVVTVLANSGFSNPSQIALDLPGGKMYWTDGISSSIYRANLDGSGLEPLITSGLAGPEGIDIDSAGGKMYWVEFQPSGRRVRRANLDGSNIETLISGLAGPQGIALDLGAGKVYYADSLNGSIHRANLNGSGIEDLITTGLAAPTDLALDTTAGKMYWIDQVSDKIQRSNLNGSNVEDLVTTGIVTLGALDLDLVEGKMYWIDFPLDSIFRANLDGTNVETVLTAAGVGGGLAIDPTSADRNGNGVLDECEVWSGLCSTPGELDFWTCFDNWDVPGDFYPDNDGSPGGIPDVFVSLPAGANVFLNEDVTIPSLHVEEGATLRVTNTDPLIGDLSFVDPAFLRIDGTLLVSANRTVGKPDALVGRRNPNPFIVGPEGVYERNPSPYLPGVSATIFAQNAFIEPGGCAPVCRNGGQVVLSEFMSMVVANDLSVVGSDPVSCSPCVIAGGVNPPPKLHGFDSSIINVGLDVVFSGAVDTVLTENAILTIGGDFRNETDAPELFDWNAGTVMMTVGTNPRTFEVAGVDFGQSETGFFTGTHTNYSIRRLEIHDGADVTFVNNFPNLVGDGPCDEALYIDTLVFRPNALVTIDDAIVYYRTLMPNGVPVNLIGCGALLPVLSPPINPPQAGSDSCYQGSTNLGTACASQSDCTLIYESSPNKDIPDGGGPSTPLIDSIEVGALFTLSDLNVHVDIEHTWVGDLIVTLEHNGLVVTLVDRAGVPANTFGCNSNNYNIVLDDEGGGGSIENLCGVDDAALTPVSPPNYLPIEPLSAFVGESMSGPWRLTVSDNASADLGKLVSWSLTFDNGVLICEGGSNAGVRCITDAECGGGGTCTGDGSGVCSVKSRYLEFVSPPPAGLQTIKVTAASVPLSPGREGQTWWAGALETIPNPPLGNLTGAALQCATTPLAQTIPVGSVYLYGSGIVPDSEYEVRLCDISGHNCSTPLTISTAKWGDVVAPFGSASQPNFSDINAIVAKFQVSVLAPDASRTDLRGSGAPGAPNTVDQNANFSDINADVGAFQGAAYPFSVGSCP